MSNGISLNGADTLVMWDRVFQDFGDGDVAHFEPQSDIATVKVGKNGNAVIALNNSGKMMLGTVRLLLGSDDDAFLNNLESQFEADPPTFVLGNLTFTKRSGDGSGTPTLVTYIGQGGIFKKKPGAKDNAEGESDQGLAIWELIFPQVIRAIL